MPARTKDTPEVRPAVVTSPLLDVEGAARYLGDVSVDLVRKLVATRQLGFCKVGALVRIPVSALDDYVASRTVGPVR